MLEKITELADKDKQISDFHLRGGSDIAYRKLGDIIIEQNSKDIIRIEEQISKTELEIKNLPKDDNYLANRRDKDRKIRRSNSKIEKLENAILKRSS